jgi:hypothetical protein
MTSGWNKDRIILSTSFLAMAGSALKATSFSAGLSPNRRGMIPMKESDSNMSAVAVHSPACIVGTLHLHIEGLF